MLFGADRREVYTMSVGSFSCVIGTMQIVFPAYFQYGMVSDSRHISIGSGMFGCCRKDRKKAYYLSQLD